MKSLTDTNATKANILQNLDWLTKDAKKGDVLIYYTQDPYGVTLDAITDTCHSGTITKEFTFGAPETGLKFQALRYMEPILDVDFFLRANPLISKQRILRTREGKRKVLT